jgi:hypothetical protein
MPHTVPARRLVAAALLAAAIAVGVGAPRTDAAIAGGSPAQRALLRQIVATLPPYRLGRLRIAPVPGGVAVRAPVHAIRPTWKLLVAGAAFSGRSADGDLPPVVEVDTRRAGWPTSNAGPRPPRATEARVDTARRRLRRLAQDSGASRFVLTVSTPDAVAVVLRLHVARAATFLQHRLRTLVIHAQAHQASYDGLLIEVDDRHGMAWADAETHLGGESFVRPGLAGCNPFPPPGPMPSLPPCPG